MRKFLITAVSVAALAAPSVAMAAQPANPGGFGQDRAAWIAANGGAAWGAIAPTRAGDNSLQNQQYMVLNGDLPAGVTPGQL